MTSSLPPLILTATRDALRAVPEGASAELLTSLNDVALWLQLGGDPPGPEQLERAAAHLETVEGDLVEGGMRDAVAVWLRKVAAGEAR